MLRCLSSLRCRRWRRAATDVCRFPQQVLPVLRDGRGACAPRRESLPGAPPHAPARPDRDPAARDTGAGRALPRRRGSWPRRRARRSRPGRGRALPLVAGDAPGPPVETKAPIRRRRVPLRRRSPSAAASQHGRAAIASARASPTRRGWRRAPAGRPGAREGCRARRGSTARRALRARDARRPRARHATHDRLHHSGFSKPPNASRSLRCTSGRPSD